MVFWRQKVPEGLRAIAKSIVLLYSPFPSLCASRKSITFLVLRNCTPLLQYNAQRVPYLTGQGGAVHSPEARGLDKAAEGPTGIAGNKEGDEAIRESKGMGKGGM